MIEDIESNYLNVHITSTKDAIVICLRSVVVVASAADVHVHILLST